MAPASSVIGSELTAFAELSMLSAGRVVHQHPIMRRSTVAVQGSQSAQHRFGPSGATAALQMFVCAWEIGQRAVHESVVFSHDQPKAGELVAQRAKNIDGVRNHRSSRDLLVLLGAGTASTAAGARARDHDKQAGS